VGKRHQERATGQAEEQKRRELDQGAPADVMKREVADLVEKNGFKFVAVKFGKYGSREEEGRFKGPDAPRRAGEPSVTVPVLVAVQDAKEGER
jgi:hypothetical protein